MEYRCQACNHLFDSDEGRPRCPRCLKLSSVVSTAVITGKRRTPAFLWYVVSGVLLLGVNATVVALTSFAQMDRGERMGAAIAHLLMGLVGLGLLILGLFKWKKQKSSR